MPSRKILSYNFVCILKISGIFSRTFSYFSFFFDFSRPGNFFPFSRFSMFSRCVRTLLTPTLGFAFVRYHVTKMVSVLLWPNIIFLVLSRIFHRLSIELVEKFKADVLMSSKIGSLIIAGDLNTRTDIFNDFLMEDEVLTNEWSNSLNFDQESISQQVRLLERSSQDKGDLSGHGRVTVEMCKATNIKIANGRIFQDEDIGKFTFHESRGSSVVDYLLAVLKVWDLIENFAVHDISCYSDHCAIEFSIRV